MTANKDTFDYIEGFYEGYLTALREFAWWKDGRQYVGSGFHKLEWAERDALSRKCERLRQHDLKAFGIQDERKKS